tara:strand:+ start:181 stop:612 length:432 start_codon:yes stop_codon:yes gene_type:complete
MKIALIFLMASISSVDFLSRFRDQMQPPMGNLESSGNFGSSPLIAHVNAEGTAHDWQAPGHRNIHVGNMGVLDPHGRRGSLTWPDGRAKYSQEDTIRQIKDGWLNWDSLKDDDRFWPKNSRPGDGSNMTPESQELIQNIWNAP